MLHRLKSKVAAAIFAVLSLLGIGTALAPAAHAENIVNQFVASADRMCNATGTAIHYSAVIQVTNLVRYRVTYIRAQVTAGSGRMRYYFFSVNQDPGLDSYAGYWGPGNHTDTGAIAWPTPWKQNPPFIVDGQIQLTNGTECDSVRIYGP